MFLFLYQPIVLLIVFSFNAGSSGSVWQGFSLHWYQELFQDRLIISGVYTTPVSYTHLRDRHHVPGGSDSSHLAAGQAGKEAASK